jgi:hypothetical protein
MGCGKIHPVLRKGIFNEELKARLTGNLVNVVTFKGNIMAAADYIPLVQSLYISYFGRPADTLGLANFTAQLEALHAPTTVNELTAAYGSTPALKTLIDSFGTSAESAALYTGDNIAFVTAIYNNVLNRAPDFDGLVFWATEINAGRLTKANASLAIMAGAINNTSVQGLLDAKVVVNKVAVATKFTLDIDTGAELAAYSGNTAAATARDMLKTVTDTTTVATFQATIDSTLATLVTASIPVQNFNLTQGTDTMVGGSGNDVFTAGPTILAADGTTIINSLQSVDNLDGAGGADSLKVTFADASTAKPIMKSVETVNVVFNDAGTLDLTASVGVTSINVANSSSTGTITGVGAAAVSISDTTFATAFTGLTGDAISLSATNVGKSSALFAIDLGSAAASKGTGELITVNNAYIDLNDTNNNAGVASATVTAAGGKNAVKFTDAAGTLKSLTVAGAGSLDVSGAALTVLASLTAADGGVTVDTTGGVLKTVTTGAGVDTITLVGATADMAVNTGAGNDTVTTVTTGVAATGTVNLGAGDDTLVMSVVAAGGATLTAGDGTDTLAAAVADYNTVSGYTAAQLAKITGFEVLSITGAALADASTVDLSSIAGLTSLKTLGVATTKAATVTNVGANASVTVAGATGTNDGTLTVTLKDATGTADVLNLIVNTDVVDNNDGTADSTAGDLNVAAAAVETINVNSTFTRTTAGTSKDFATNTVVIADTALVNLKVTGDAATVFAANVGMTKLVSIDASAATGTQSIDASLIVGGGKDLTIKGAAAAANTIVGADLNDTITGGSKGDTITGGIGGDTLKGNGGNDIFVYTAAAQSTIAAGNADTISDFVANTYGQGTNGAATSAGATMTLGSRTGDVLTITNNAANLNTVTVGVYTNAADATTFLATQSATEGAAGSQTVHAALNSTTGDLYIDIDGNGTTDLYIHLTGVTTLTAAAFVIV